MKKLIIFVVLSCASVCLTAQNKKPYATTVGEFFTNPVGYSLEDLSFS